MGVLRQSSIGFDVPTGGSEYKDGIRYLKEIRLWEISLVTFAANEEAIVLDVKQSPSERPYEIQSTKVGKVGTKDFNSAYAQAQIDEILEKWRCVLIASLRSSMYEAFRGEQPIKDMKQNLAQFTASALEWSEEALQLGLQAYLQKMAGSYAGGYEMMSRQYEQERKATLQEVATKLASMIEDKPTEASQANEKSVPPIQAHGDALVPSSQDTVSEQELAEALQRIRSLRVAVTK